MLSELKFIFRLFFLLSLVGLLGSKCSNDSPGAIQCVANAHVLTHNTDNIEDIDEVLINSFANYLIKMKVGDPAQELEFAVDTGSSNILVMGENCTTCHPRNIDFGRYKPPSGTTPLVTGETLSFGSGSTTADGYADKIALLCQETPVSSGIWSVTSSAGINDNILGLAYPSFINQVPGQPKKTFFEILIDAYPDTKNEFSLTLCGENGGQSLIAFGEKDPRLTKDQVDTMLWTDVTEQSYYNIKITDVYLGEKKLGSFDGLPENQQPMIDSGTTLMQLPESIFNNLLPELQKYDFLPSVDGTGKKFWDATSLASVSISNGNLDKLPNIIFTLPYSSKSEKSGNFTLTISPNRYMKLLPDGRRIFAIQSVPLPPPYRTTKAILGLPFLENFSIAFNRDDNRVGFYANNLEICSQTGVN